MQPVAKSLDCLLAIMSIRCMLADMPPDSTFVRNLRHLKERSGLTWVEIAEGLGYGSNITDPKKRDRKARYLLTLLAGKYEPRQETIRKLAAFFEVPESYFSEEH